MSNEGDGDLISDAESSDDDKSIKGTKNEEQNFFRYKILNLLEFKIGLLY